MFKHMLRVSLFLVAFSVMHAQSTIDYPSYVVQSVQHSKSVASLGHLTITSRRLDARSVSLRDLISKAYDMPSVLIFNLDPDIAETRYDIVATYEPKPGEQVRPHDLLRSLLTNQFGIMAHRQTETVPLYAMTVVPNGSQIQPTIEPGGINSDLHSFAAHGVTMDFVATDLSDTMKAIVINRTALPSRYTFSFAWQPSTDPVLNIAAIRQAAEQQAGLRLESTQARVEVLEVDHIDVASR